MSAIPKPKMTEAEYLAFEETSDVKHEFYNGEIFAMAGASRQHCDIAYNLRGELFTRFKGGPCRASFSEQRVKVNRTGLYTYPDLLIACEPREFEKDTLLNPSVVIEILSPSTESYDRGIKFEHYQNLPSVREYVLVRQDRMRIERLVRQPDETWLLTAFDDPSGSFSLATLPISIPLVDVYRGVKLPDGQNQLKPYHGPSED